MLTHDRRLVSLSFLSTDLSICCGVEAAATLYQKDSERFHLVWTEPVIADRESTWNGKQEPESIAGIQAPRLLWLELSPYRVTMTMQGNGQSSYRHLWVPGVYGFSRYWLQGDANSLNGLIGLRNFTRSLTLKGDGLPTYLRVEYELWSEQLLFGHYVLSLEIYH